MIFSEQSACPPSTLVQGESLGLGQALPIPLWTLPPPAQVLWKTCIGLSSVLLVSTFLPAHLFAGFLMYPFGCIVGLGQAATFIIPDAILADIIDYDELLTGTRTEGMYTVLESNLQQYVEIFAGVLPGILMGFSGFQNNGGCVCGCGVSCSSPFVRWDCPGDIGCVCAP